MKIQDKNQKKKNTKEDYKNVKFSKKIFAKNHKCERHIFFSFFYCCHDNSRHKHFPFGNTDVCVCVSCNVNDQSKTKTDK